MKILQTLSEAVGSLFSTTPRRRPVNNKKKNYHVIHIKPRRSLPKIPPKGWNYNASLNNTIRKLSTNRKSPPKPAPRRPRPPPGPPPSNVVRRKTKTPLRPLLMPLSLHEIAKIRTT